MGEDGLLSSFVNHPVDFRLIYIFYQGFWIGWVYWSAPLNNRLEFPFGKHWSYFICGALLALVGPMYDWFLPWQTQARLSHETTNDFNEALELWEALWSLANLYFWAVIGIIIVDLYYGKSFRKQPPSWIGNDDFAPHCSFLFSRAWFTKHVPQYQPLLFGMVPIITLKSATTSQLLLGYELQQRHQHQQQTIKMMREDEIVPIERTLSHQDDTIQSRLAPTLSHLKIGPKKQSPCPITPESYSVRRRHHVLSEPPPLLPRTPLPIVRHHSVDGRPTDHSHLLPFLPLTLNDPSTFRLKPRRTTVVPSFI